MKRLILLSSVGLFFLVGCSQEQPLAKSVVELSGNPQVIGWQDKNYQPEVKVVYKTKVIREPVKDSDNDGVVDALDKCPYTPKGLIVDHNGCPIIATLRINFDVNKAEVKKIYYPEIKKIALAIRSNPNIKKIEVSGFTDNTGSEEYNKKLSLKRAKAVADLLVKFGVNPKIIEVKGYGADFPLVPNTTDTNRALNRRVEIVDVTNRVGG
jgi:OOP family OmpA-OmpF porin